MTKKYLGLICSCAFALLCSGPLEAVESAAPGEVIVLFRNNSGERLTRSSALRGAPQFHVAAAAAAAGARVVRTYGALSESVDGVFVLLNAEGRTTEQLTASLRSNPSVLAISPNRPLYALEEKIPNDPHFDKLWGMRDIDAPESWSETTGDNSVRVAVLDTGIATGHEDLKDNIDTLNSRCFSPFYAEDAYEDDAGHGTHVSGIVGAVGDNQKGVAGVSWRGKVIAYKVLNASGSGSTATVIRGLDSLLGLLRSQPSLKIAAVNLSLGGYSAETPEEMEKDSAEWRAYKALDDTDRVVIVVAAGNEGLEVGEPAPFDDSESLFRPRFSRGDYCYPASFTGLNNMIVVGAMAEEGKGAYFSNWSQTKVDVAAPGAKIYSTTPKGVVNPREGVYGLYGFMSGTSMAAPHVAGAAGLLMSKFPSLKAHELKEAILNGAKSSVNPVAEPFPAKSDYQGINPREQKLSAHGFLNIKGALEWLNTRYPEVPPDPSLKPQPEPEPRPNPKPQPRPEPQPTPAPEPQPKPAPEPQPSPAPKLPQESAELPIDPAQWTATIGAPDTQGLSSVSLTCPMRLSSQPDAISASASSHFVGGVTCSLAWDGSPVEAFALPAEMEGDREYRLKLEGRVPASALDKATISAVCFRFKDGSMLEKGLGSEGLTLGSVPRANPDPDNNQPDRKTSGHAGGSGCDTGFAGLLLLAALPLLLRVKS